MRRRQIFAYQFGEKVRALLVDDLTVICSDPVIAFPLTFRDPPEVVPPVKGTCPTCQNIFPRGLHLHTRACKGADQ